MLYVYDKITFQVIAKFSDVENPELIFQDFPIEQKKRIGFIFDERDILEHKTYKVINNKLVKISDLEIQEIRKYGKILTVEERQLQKLKPSPEEVRKAENTIEILTLIQEVM